MSNEDDLKWKTTLNGRWPQNRNSRVFQQPLVRSYSNMKIKLIGLNQRVQSRQMKITSNGIRHKMEDEGGPGYTYVLEWISRQAYPIPIWYRHLHVNFFCSRSNFQAASKYLFLDHLRLNFMKFTVLTDTVFLQLKILPSVVLFIYNFFRQF